MSFSQFAMADVQEAERYRDLSKAYPFYAFAAWRFDSFVGTTPSAEVEDLAVQFFCSLPHNFTTWKYAFTVQGKRSRSAD